jgi:hypothetical protein
MRFNFELRDNGTRYRTKEIHVIRPSGGGPALGLDFFSTHREVWLDICGN